MTDLDTILEQATPAERTVQVCVAGKLLAEYEHLERELARAQTADAQRSSLGDVPQAPPIARRLVEIEERMQAATHEFRFRALEPKPWSDLLAEHPGRPGKTEGFNAETFPAAAIAACCVEPAGLDSVPAVERLFAVLNPAQRADLFDGVWTVNTATVTVPFSASASAVLRASGPSSTTAQPEAFRDPSSSGA